MFWLFRRKKVADKKAITPCICDNGDQTQDTFTLHDFGGSRASSDSGEPCGRGSRKGYRRLHADCPFPDDPAAEADPPPPPTPGPGTPPQPPPRLDNADFGSASSSSTDSSSECDVDYYFGNFSDTDDEEEELTCNVCERSFRSVRRLEQHQQRKRHYGCCVCDSVFPSLMALELHKETLDHWSDYELRLRRFHEGRPSDDEDDDDSEDELDEHSVYRGRRRDELRRLLL